MGARLEWIALCGQAPSNDPDVAKLLVRAGIDAVSVPPDAVLDVRTILAEAEAGL
ncbi:MAG: putative PEP-binding protein [Pseudomonadota bacterium]